MKKSIIFCILSAMVITMLFTACDNDDQEIIRFSVASERIYVNEPVSSIPTLSLLVRYPGETRWRHFSETIEGFSYELGCEYIIDVEVIPVKDPPMDASAEKYRLKEIVSQVKIQSEGLPDDSVKE